MWKALASRFGIIIMSQLSKTSVIYGSQNWNLTLPAQSLLLFLPFSLPILSFWYSWPTWDKLFCLDGTSFWANGRRIHFFELLELIVENLCGCFLFTKDMLNIFSRRNRIGWAKFDVPFFNNKGWFLEVFLFPMVNGNHPKRIWGVENRYPH